jgi:hypothetical protein
MWKREKWGMEKQEMDFGIRDSGARVKKVFPDARCLKPSAGA